MGVFGLSGVNLPRETPFGSFWGLWGFTPEAPLEISFGAFGFTPETVFGAFGVFGVLPRRPPPENPKMRHLELFWASPYKIAQNRHAEYGFRYGF